MITMTFTPTPVWDGTTSGVEVGPGPTIEEYDESRQVAARLLRAATSAVRARRAH